MKKIIWIDVGTHFAQEYCSIFGSNINFYGHIIKRFVGAKILKRGAFLNFQGLRNVIYSRARIRKRYEEFYTVFIEANPKIAYTRNIYVKADMVFNIAMTDDNQPSPSIIKLYLGGGGDLAQGGSVFLKKGNVLEDTYIPTLGISSGEFFNQLSKHLNEKFSDYDVLLRLNCEGVEDDVIFSAYDNFGSKLKLICGSLKDVEEIKGIEASKKLEKFMKEKELLFMYFSSQLFSWPKAHEAVLNLLNKKDKN